MLKTDSFETLVKFTIYYLIKTRVTQVRSNVLFIKLFRIKTLISSVEDYYLSILAKSIELLEQDFGLSSNRSENANKLIHINKEDTEEMLVEFSKKELLATKFNKFNKGVLNPVSK